MKATFGPCDKAYRDHWLRAEGFEDTLEYDWRKTAKLTARQQITVAKLSGGYWTIEIDGNGNANLIMRERMFARNLPGHDGEITYSFGKKDQTRSTETECIAEFGEDEWSKMLEQMDETGYATLPKEHTND